MMKQSLLIYVAICVARSTCATATALRRQQTETSCSISGFSLYDGEVDGGSIVPMPSVLDRNDHISGKISIIANLTGSFCSAAVVGCVKLSFAGVTKHERVSPYTLYGDQPGGQITTGWPADSYVGMQTLEATLYSDRSCSRKKGYKSMSVEVKPLTTTSVSPIIEATPFGVKYEGTIGPVTQADTDEVAGITCEYFKMSLGNGLIYKCLMSLIEFNCDYASVPVEQGLPLIIRFDVSAKYKRGEGEEVYCRNRALPTLADVDKNLVGNVQNTISAGPNIPYLIETLQSDVSDANPFSAVTGTSLAS